MRELTASDITKEVLLKLRASGCTVWRNATWSGGNRRNIVKSGIPDIIGYSAKGLFVACEVKKIGDKFSGEQIKFLDELKEKGGLALYAIEQAGEVKIINWI